MTFFTGQAKKPWQDLIFYVTFFWVFLKALVSNSVACIMTPIEGFLIYLWWFSGAVVFVCPNL
jgi:hypothetical protein